jgi:CBS domain-containing protein
MQVKDIMTQTPTYITSAATIQEAAQKMRDLDCGFVPVAEGEKLVGVVTDRDITLRATAAGVAFTSPVSQIMSKNVYYCTETDSIEAVTKNMSAIEVRRLIVLNNTTDKKLVGVVSVADIATACNCTATTGQLTQLIQAVSQTKGQKTKAA